MNNKAKITIIIVAIIGGIILSWQYLLSQKIDANINPQTSESLAYEVSEIFLSNQKLAKEVDKLSIEVGKLQESYIDLKTSDETLDEKIKNYKTILGIGEIEGQGVKIEFDKKISSVHLVDLINALKNIGVEGIAINNKRIIYNSSIEEGIFSPPMKVFAIGDSELLYSSLIRPGGIMDQIGYGKVNRLENIILPSI